MPIINQVVQGGGTTPTGTLPITNNGTYDVTNYASADVNVPTTAPALYRELQLDGTGKLIPSTTTTHVMDFTGVTDVDSYVLYSAYNRNSNIDGTINMPDIVNPSSTFSMAYAFQKTHVSSVSMQNLVNVSGNNAMDSMFNETKVASINFPVFKAATAQSCCRYMFYKCLLTQVSLPAFESVTGGGFSLDSGACYDMFGGNTLLTSIELPVFKQVSGNYGLANFVEGCTALPTFRFCSLGILTGTYALRYAFMNCTSMQSIWFYALTPTSFSTTTNQFNGMLSGCTNVTVHFPMAIQTTIGSWSDVTGGFGGTNTTVLFDIVTSLTGADGNTYTRSEKDSTSTATAWTYNDTLYYTSGVSNNTAGVNEPSVADTIYSDDACTTSVTTITAIA